MPPASMAQTGSLTSRLGMMALLLVAIWLAAAALPAVPAPIGPGLDLSWVLGVNLAHAEKLAHGTDIVWTYGPLSYLSLPVAGIAGMYPVLLYRLGTYLLWCIALIRLSVAAPGIRYWVVPLLGITAIIDPLVGSDYLPVAIFGWSLLIVMDRSPRWRSAGLLLLAFLAALTCLVKANSGVAAICLFIAVLTVVVCERAPLSKYMRRALAGAVLLLPISVVLLYAAETGTVISLPAYVRNSLEIASGYTEAMTFNGLYEQVLIAVISMAVFFVVLPLAELLPLAKGSIRNLVGYLPALVYVFFAFKACMVRQDTGHAADFELQLALAALFPLVTARRKPYLFATMCFQLVCLFLGYQATTALWPLTARSRLEMATNGPVFKAFLRWPRAWAALDKAGWENLEQQQVSPELQAAIGSKSVEVIPWDVTRVRANHWNWRPRPVFQTYAAYTPRLDDLNAAHLRSGKAADFTMVTWEDIDGRHLFLEAPFSWQAQLDRYDTVMTDAAMVLLGRRATARFQSVQPLTTETVSWDQPVSVPQSPDPVTLSAHIGRSWFGRLRGLIFRSNPLWIEVTRKSGIVERYRALRANFADGVILNELPADLSDLALLDSGCSLSDPVVTFHFHTDSLVEFQPSIPLQWARLVRRPETPGACVQAAATSMQTTFPAWGGPGTVTVSAGTGARWTATANDWIAAQPLDSSGNATVNYVILKNSAPQSRHGGIDIGGHPFHFFQRGIEPHSFQFGLYNPEQYNAPITPPQVKGLDLTTDLFDGFAMPGDQLVIGDWTGNGMMRLGVFRGGKWFLDLNGNRRWDGANGGDGVFSFGLPGDIAAPGDWTGDGKTKLGVFRKGIWVLDNGNMAFDRADRFLNFGLAGDIPVVGKWSHDRIDRVGIFRDGLWLVDSTGVGEFQLSDERFTFGIRGDLPIVAFSNGNVGVYRNGTCILAPSGVHGFTSSAMTIPCGTKQQRLLIAAW